IRRAQPEQGLPAKRAPQRGACTRHGAREFRDRASLRYGALKTGSLANRRYGTSARAAAYRGAGRKPARRGSGRAASADHREVRTGSTADRASLRRLTSPQHPIRLVYALDPYRQAVARLWNRPDLPTRHIIRGKAKFGGHQQIVKEALRLHVG